MKGYQTYIFDIDGTIIKQNIAIPGAIKTLDLLRQEGKQLLFATNTPLTSKKKVAEKLRTIGFTVYEEEIITPIDALEFYFNEAKQSVKLLPLVAKDVRDELESRGYKLAKPGDVGSTHVLLGMNEELDYQAYCNGLREIDRGALLLILNGDLYCPTIGGRVPDSGALSAVLTNCTNVMPINVGKPTIWMQQAILTLITSSVKNCLFVGDSPATDMKIGRALGMDTCLVQTGVTTFLKEQNYSVTYLLNSINEMSDFYVS